MNVGRIDYRKAPRPSAAWRTVPGTATSRFDHDPRDAFELDHEGVTWRVVFDVQSDTAQWRAMRDGVMLVDVRGHRLSWGLDRTRAQQACEILMRDGAPTTDARADVAPLQSERILAFLADGPKTNAEIGKVLHILPRYFGATLRRMHEEGRVSKRLVKGAGLARSGLVLWALPGCEERLEMMARRIMADPPAEVRATRTNMGMPRRRVA